MRQETPSPRATLNRKIAQHQAKSQRSCKSIRKKIMRFSAYAVY
ncbi:hypothetical protein CG394_03560 [Gardnerella vaginalis]|uniref:Uncharacterized protein n=1 Tax=Gardnerella vaginalis (strain ATCC 14019 / 317) TaxID=525284 RepID=E3D835_GARV3|nr:hypothetical protein HMPREF0421_20184 [Gardnerella vaginalis ATCC 14019]AYZ21309.1 hypothetical protein EGX90_01735 [Gardnerella vaginalis]EGL14787.1 hypothetical protein HMPREF9435_0213 [Gardnerella vaginalis 315-A]TCH82859.1 hypothetical protein E0E46_02220 [Gardnerella vaginalis ATCC 14018 = JCM 11026]PKZ45484.1 hypothetical protein CYJ68_00120 [Gardnerella vaginalis]